MANIADIKPGVHVVEILHPATGQPIGIKWPLHHVDDDRAKAIRRRINDDRISNESKGKPIKSEQLEENRRATLFTLSDPWTWYNPTGNPSDPNYDPSAMPDFNGEIPEFNKKNVYAVLKALPWIEKQLAEPMEDVKNFFDELARS